MIDIHEIRQNPAAVQKKLSTREAGIDIEPIRALDDEMRKLKTLTEEAQAKRNALSKQIGEKKRAGEDVTYLMEEIASLGKHKEQLTEIEEKLQATLSYLPNIPDDDAPVSLDPADNVCVRTHGEKPTFDFRPKHHLELNEALDLFDFEKSARIAGTGWPLYTGFGARLEWALLNFMLDFHVKNGFQMMMPPLVCRPEIMYGSGQLPKFADQLYKLEDDLYLNPTSEVVLNGQFADTILPADSLPHKYVAYTPCFRREAGAAGSGERGLIRTHQFNKVEMFCFARPEDSDQIHQDMVSYAEALLQALGLHYRVMDLVTGDLGFGATRCFDIEVWLPGQNRYYEVSSVSNCRAFQARRSKIRARDKNEKPFLVHTLNGSGLATSRLLVALLENNQNPDGTISIPTALQAYFPFKTLEKHVDKSL